MKRLFRRIRRNPKPLGRKQDSKYFTPRTNASALNLESLESRVLLTTLVLPKGSTGVTRFIYADAGDNDPGSEVNSYNEVRIGTLSGMGPSEDVIVELLNYRGDDIPGSLSIGGGEFSDVFGGPGGVNVIDEVPPDELGGLAIGAGSINALATSNAGITYGINQSGILSQINTTSGTATPIGRVVDSLNHPGAIGEITYSNFEAACFDPETDTMYAVVFGPTSFDTIGEANNYGWILITIDVNTGEASAAGHNNSGQPDYKYSVIASLDAFNFTSFPDRITTIAYDPNLSAQNPTGGPVFIAYAQITNFVGSTDDPPDAFFTVSVNPAGATPVVNVVASPILYVDETSPIEGLMYATVGNWGDQLFLFGLMGGTENRLVNIDLFPGANVDPYTDVIDYGNNPLDSQIVLTGMTFDAANGMGYATDPNTSTLYTINTNALNLTVGTTGGLNFEVEGGLADVYLVYIAQSTADVYITFTYSTYTEEDGFIYDPTGGDTAFICYDTEAETEIETPDTAGGVMIGTVPIVGPEDDVTSNPDYLWSPTTFLNSSELSVSNPGSHGAWPGGYFRPGIILAHDTQDADGDGADDPQNIGKIQVGGGVFGDVVIHGSIDTFYAGCLGTNNFIVEGEINTLAVNTTAGGVNGDGNVWVPVGTGDHLNYISRNTLGSIFDGDEIPPVLEVFGSMGSFYSDGGDNSSWGLPIRIHGNSDAPTFPGILDPSVSNPAKGYVWYVNAYREIERKATDEEHTSYFPSGVLDTSNTGEWILSNDSPYLAQYLGSAEGDLSVIGAIEDGDGGFDAEDYYSFAVTAGQTITLKLYYTGGYSNVFSGNPAAPDSTAMPLNSFYNLSLYDPELSLVATSGNADLNTDASDTGEPGGETTIQFTAERSGIYTISVYDIDSVTYRLDIQGLNPMSLGGGNVVGDMRDCSIWGEMISSIQVMDGDLGAVSIGGVARGGEIRVDNGNLTALRAATNAIDPAGTDLNYGVNRFGDNTPRHSNATDIVAPEPIPTVGFGYERDFDSGSLFNQMQVHASGNIGMISSILRSGIDVFAGADIQSFRIGGNLYAPLAPGDDQQENTNQNEVTLQNYSGVIVANGNIGEIWITGHYGPVMWSDAGDAWSIIPCGIFANADGIGDPGVMDSIIIGGDVGRSSNAPANDAVIIDIPISTGHNINGAAGGGNIRYVDIRGNIFSSLAGWYEEPAGGTGSAFGPFEFNRGQSVTIVDDSGALITLSPGHTGAPVDDYLFGLLPTQVPSDFNLPQTGDGGILTVKLLPIQNRLYSEFMSGYSYVNWSKVLLGFAVVDVHSTDGLRVKAEGASVEIGSLTIEGRVDDSIILSGDEPISVMRITASAPTAGNSNSSNNGVVPNTGISKIINRTIGGDILSITVGTPSSAPGTVVVNNGTTTPGVTGVNSTVIERIEVHGNLGMTYSTTGQLIRSTILNLVSEGSAFNRADATVNTDPGGTQWVGLISTVDVIKIDVTGALADVDIRGNVSTIVVNSDNSRELGQFDGIVGPIIVYGNINRIDPGDGVPTPGVGRFAQAGIFAYGSINKLEISGDGHDIAGPVYARQAISKISVTNGARILGYNALYGYSGERVRGAYDIAPTIATTSEFDDYMVAYLTFTRGGGGTINDITVSGTGSEIRSATIWSDKINKLTVNGGANGVFDSRIYARNSSAFDMGIINQIKIAGAGIYNTVISASREIKQVTIASGGKMEDCLIESQFHITKVIADEINRTTITAINEIDNITSNGDVFDLTVATGELGSLKVGGDMLGSSVTVRGKAKEISAKGNLVSTIDIIGKYGDLGKLSAGGNIGTPTGGKISIDGKVGTISAGGDFLADFNLNWDPTPVGPTNTKGPHAKYNPTGIELGSLKVAGKIVGIGNIGGDVSSIQCNGEFGTFLSQFNVYGDLKKMVVGSKKQISDLESSLKVEGNLGSLTVNGNVNGKIDVTESIKTISIIGSKDHMAYLNASVRAGGPINKIVFNYATMAATDVVDGGAVTITPVPLNWK